MNNAMFYAWMSQASYLYFNDSIQHIVQTKNDAAFEFALSESKRRVGNLLPTHYENSLK